MVAAKPMNDTAVHQLAIRRNLNEKTKTNFRLLVALTVLHLPLGLFDYYATSAAILHPAAVFGLGMYWALQRKIRLERVALVVGYFMGVEVLWRMAQVPIFWEFGKYGSVVIMIVALLRRGQKKIPTVALVYFAALLPACVLTFVQFDLSAAKDTLSFNLSGPFFLLISCWFFSHIKVDPQQLRRLFEAFIVPLLSVAFVTLFFTVAVKDIQFTDESNFATSGGYGPNQVSAMLGLGVFLTVFSLISLRNDSKYKLFFAVAAVFFAIQSIMTFSRGGIYNAAGALMLVALFEFGDPLTATKRLIPIAAVIVLFFIFVFPFLNNFTGGNLQLRFEDTQTTHRAEIVESDIDIFLEHPVLGVGVGAAYSERQEFLGFKAASHTEFSRLISEHGLFGLVAICCMLAMVGVNFKRSRSRVGRAFVLGAAAWAVLFMLNTGMRLAAPAAVFGMIFITIGAPRRQRNIRALRKARVDQNPAKAPVWNVIGPLEGPICLD